MNITSAIFVKGVVGEGEIMQDGVPQIAFLGRSNVGKSTLINTLVRKKELARSSPTPGHTRQINFYLINKNVYFVDLPGYGFAKGSKEERNNLANLISWYIDHPNIEQKLVVLIVDAYVGVTELDREVLGMLEQAGRTVVVIANKIDKIKKTQLQNKIHDISDAVHPYPVIPFSSETKVGVLEVTQAILK